VWSNKMLITRNMGPAAAERQRLSRPARYLTLL
jgi:hypothetical protein